MLSFGAESFVFQVAMKNIKIYRTIILPIVLYECEIWSLTFRGGKETEGVSEHGVEENIWT